jgi:hypothetical protein
MGSWAPAETGATASASASKPFVNRIARLRCGGLRHAQRRASSRSDGSRCSDLLVARKGASPPRDARRRVLIRPLGDIRGRLHHALHQRLLRDELKPPFVALARRSERAHRQNQLDHRPPVVKRSPSGHCGILNGRPQRWELIGVVGAYVTMGPKSSHSLSRRRLGWSVAAALGKTHKVSQCRDEFA